MMSSFKEKIKTLKYALVVTKEYNVKLAFLSLFKCVFTAVGPLIPTYYIAKMLDELSGGKNVKQIIIYAVSMVVLCSLVHYFSSRLNMIMSAIYDKIYFQESEIFMKKIVSLDYELLENKEFRTTSRRIKMRCSTTAPCAFVYGTWCRACSAAFWVSACRYI